VTKALLSPPASSAICASPRPIKVLRRTKPTSCSWPTITIWGGCNSWRRRSPGRFPGGTESLPRYSILYRQMMQS